MTYKDAGLSCDNRARLLLSEMDLDEKIGQLRQLFGWKAVERKDGKLAPTEQFQETLLKGGIGSLYGTLRADPWSGITLQTGFSPREGAEAINLLQRMAVEGTRLGIPILFGEECSHGHMAIGATVFPVPLSIGSSWNPALLEEIGQAIALETRAQGGAVTYSPVLDVVRDPRWGRTEECFGEDPYLVGRMGEAVVRGMQGRRLDSPNSIGVTLKHYAAYGSSEGGRNGAPVHIGLRELHEIDLFPFRQAVRAGALSVMPAYNEIDGIPCTANRYLLEEVLRRQWGFDGFVITDCGAIDMLAEGHNIAASGEEAVAMALKAGVDMEMSGYMYGTSLRKAIERGKVSMEELDQAVIRVLEAKFRLGLFEQPYADPVRAEVFINNANHRELAKEAAIQGTVLLKNEGGILPLQRNSIQRIAVIGPNADSPYNQLGDYTSPQPPGKSVTVLEGIRTKLAGLRTEVLFSPGCRIRDASTAGFSAAVEAAASADAVVLVLGGSSARDFGEGTVDQRTGASLAREGQISDMDCGEGIDRADLGLSGVQLALAQEIGRVGKPLIVVYINGRPIIEPWVDENAAAILEVWYPGQEGGHAIADILFGDANPSGRLSLSLPKHAGQVPLLYNGKRTRGRRYLEVDTQPRYPFGYGLCYTTFDYGKLCLSRRTIGSNESTEISVIVTNSGARAGYEVVQLYVSDLVSSFTRAEKELKDFRKIYLEPGESAEVTFCVGFEELSLLGADLRKLVEPGEFRITIGPNAAEGLQALLTVEGEWRE